MGSGKETKLLNIRNICYSVLSEPDGSSFELIKTAGAAEDDKTVEKPANLVVIDSIHSGKGRTAQGDFYTIVMKPIFDVLNIKHTLIKTSSRDTISTYAAGLDVSQHYTVLFLSGDTSISEFINNLPQVPVDSELGILPFPMGSGNAWASSLGIMCPIETFGKFIRGNTSYSPFPLYRAVFPNSYSILFFIILSMGFHANLIHASERPEYANMGVEKFQKAAVFVMEEYDLDLNISVGDRSGSYSYFALINTPKLEPTYRPSPESDPLKEELHLLGYSSKLSKEELLTKVLQGYRAQPNSKLTVDEGTTYAPLTEDFEVTLNFPVQDSPVYKAEICCDGVLLNLRDLQPANNVSNKFTVEFVHHYPSFKLLAMSPT